MSITDPSGRIGKILPLAMKVGRATSESRPAWVTRLLEHAIISPRALREFSKLNPDIPWQSTSDVLRFRLETGRPRRRKGWQPRVELVTGTTVPLDYIEVQIRGRQVAMIRKDRLGENKVASVRRLGSVVDADPAGVPRQRRRRRSLAA